MSYHAIFLIKFDSENKETLAIDDEGKVKRFRLRPKKLLSMWAESWGSSYEGSKKTFCALTKGKQKPAILVCFQPLTLFFPTSSEKHEDCVYLRYDVIEKCRREGDCRTRVIFVSGMEQIVDCNIRIIHKQMKRCKTFMRAIPYHSFLVEERFKDYYIQDSMV